MCFLKSKGHDGVSLPAPEDMCTLVALPLRRFLIKKRARNFRPVLIEDVLLRLARSAASRPKVEDMASERRRNKGFNIPKLAPRLIPFYSLMI